MTPSRLQKFTGLLLAAGMLLGSTMPPGQRHAHAGGETAHQHRTHHHGAEQAGHHHGDHKHADATAVRPVAVSHVHLNWWLLSATLPMSVPADPEPASHDARDVAVPVRLMDDFLPASGKDFVELATTISDPAPVAAAPASRLLRAPAPPGPAVLLCDRARHERSGVQLF